MFNVYLFIELLGAANPDSAIADVRKLEFADCKLANIVALSGEKLVAQLDCKTAGDASRAVIEKIATVEGIVQTNIIAVVRPTK